MSVLDYALSLEGRSPRERFRRQVDTLSIMLGLDSDGAAEVLVAEGWAPRPTARERRGRGYRLGMPSEVQQ